jgi:hypothetical protein
MPGVWRPGVRVCVNRPPAAVLPLLDALVKNRRYSACVSRINFAYDFEMETPEAADALMAWIDHYIVLKWRSAKTRKMVRGKHLLVRQAQGAEHRPVQKARWRGAAGASLLPRPDSEESQPG